jgi:hypothetical protein
MGRQKQRRAQARDDDNLNPATITIPPRDFPLMERLVAQEVIPSDDPMYQSAKMAALGLVAPFELENRAKRLAMERHDGTRLGVYRVLAYAEAAMRKAAAEQGLSAEEMLRRIEAN